MRAIAAAGLLLLADGALAAAAAADRRARMEPGPAPGAVASPECHYLGEFRVTYYFVAEEDARYAGLPRPELLRDPRGRVLARVSTAFRRELDREGTGRLGDGRLLNVATRRDGRWRYAVLPDGWWGAGAGGGELVPLVSVAADPLRVPLGSRLVLPAFSGALEMAGGPHPGDFVVADVGSAIRGDRLDVFLGRRDWLAAAEAVVPSHAPTPVFLLAPPASSECPAGGDRAAAGRGRKGGI